MDLFLSVSFLMFEFRVRILLITHDKRRFTIFSSQI